MLTPKLTIITVCYNAGSVLTRTIESVISQSYSNLEYIIIDADSSDSTKIILAQYAHKVSKIIIEKDDGIYDAMNKGIHCSTGELILFLNAGDYLVTHDAIDFFISKIKINKANLFFGKIVWNDRRFKWLCLSDHQKVSNNWELIDSNFPHPATIYKRTIFSELGTFDLKYSIAADYEFNLRALVKYRVPFQYIETIVTVFFADGISNNSENEAKHKAEVNAINEHYLHPKWLYNSYIKSINNKVMKLFRDKLISKIYNFNLNRVY